MAATYSGLTPDENGGVVYEPTTVTIQPASNQTSKPQTTGILVLSVVSVFCCFPLGLAAVILAGLFTIFLRKNLKYLSWNKFLRFSRRIVRHSSFSGAPKTHHRQNSSTCCHWNWRVFRFYFPRVFGGRRCSDVNTIEQGSCFGREHCGSGSHNVAFTDHTIHSSNDNHTCNRYKRCATVENLAHLGYPFLNVYLYNTGPVCLDCEHTQIFQLSQDRYSDCLVST